MLKLASLFDGLARSRGDIKSAYRAMLADKRSRADLLVAETKTFDRVVAPEDKILGAFDAVGKRLDGHDALFSSLALETCDGRPGGDTQPEAAAPWSEGVK